RLRASESQAADIFRGDVDARRENDLLVDALFLDIFQASFHVVAGNLPLGDLAVTPVDLGIVYIRMAVRGPALGVPRIQRMNPLGIVISAVAHSLRRESSVALGEIVRFVHEVTFTQVGMQTDNHLSSSAGR